MNKKTETAAEGEGVCVVEVRTEGGCDVIHSGRRCGDELGRSWWLGTRVDSTPDRWLHCDPPTRRENAEDNQIGGDMAWGVLCTDWNVVGERSHTRRWCKCGIV